MHISKKGFTLMEMMIVIAVLAILFAALTPFAQVYLARARDTTRITDLDTIRKALVAYENDNGKMPLTFTKPPKEFMASTVDLIPDVSAAGMCPMIGIICGVGLDPYQNPTTCAESCVAMAPFPSTDDQCMSYISDPKFNQILPNVPRDPKRTITFPCLDSSNVGSYGYATGSDSLGKTHIILTAEFETPTIANVGYIELNGALNTGDIESLQNKKKGDYVDTASDSPLFIVYD